MNLNLLGYSAPNRKINCIAQGRKIKVFQILKFTDDILELKQVYYCVIQFHIVFTRLHGMQRDLHCNPMKVVVSGKVLFVPGGRKWGSLRD